MPRKRRASREVADFTDFKRQRVNIRPKIDASSVALHLKEQQPPPFDSDSPSKSFFDTSHEIYADIDSQSLSEKSIGSVICVASIERNYRENTATSQLREEIDGFRDQPLTPLFTVIDDKVQNKPQERIMASDLAACLIAKDRVELTNLRNARDLAAATQSAEQLIRANRAASTRKSYDQKVARWKQWCADREFDDHDTVTENKLFLYLSSEVVPKGVQTRGKRMGTALSEEGLDGYIKPVVALYKVFSFNDIILNNKGTSSPS
jgi:hypothetical protein